MNFLNPYLLFGLIGAGVPLFIHLLNRFRPKVVEWGAMVLLRRVMLTKSRRIKLEDIIILTLRTLAISMFVLALARPAITARGGGWLGTQPGVVVALDASMSMMHGGEAATRFDQARERARQIFETLDPGDPVTLVLLGSRPRVLLRNVGYDYELFENELRKASALPETMNLEPGFEVLARTLAEMTTASRECYVITDFQSSIWENLSSRAAASLREIADIASLMLVAVDASQSENLAVTQLEYVSGAFRVGSRARYRVGISNTGQHERSRVVVRLVVNETTVDQRSIEKIMPGDTVVVPMLVEFAEAGTASLKAVIDVEADKLEVDNRRYAVAGVDDSVRILCLTGTASGPGDERLEHRSDPETVFLMSALKPRSSRLPGHSIQIDVVPYLTFSPSTRLDDYSIVLLANVPELPERAVAALHAFVNRGGSLVVFLGDRVSPDILNARMQFNGESLLPGVVLAPVGDDSRDSEGWQIRVADSQHPLARTLASLPGALMAEAVVYRYFGVEAFESGRVILRCGEDGKPLLLTKTIGNGRVVLFTSTANRQWTNLPLNPAYPILLQDMVTYLTRQAWEEAISIGSRWLLPLNLDMSDGSAVFTDPSGASMLVNVTSSNGVAAAELPEIAVPGFYELETDAESLRIAANVHPRESDVTAMDVAELAGEFEGSGVRVLGSDARLDDEIRQVRIGTELWRYLLIAAAVLFIAETALSNRFSRDVNNVNEGFKAATAFRREMP